MRFYGLSDSHVMQMPVNRFWFLYHNSHRIEAHEDLRRLQVAIVTAGMEPSKEGVVELQGMLSRCVGVTIKYDQEVLGSQGDPDAIDKLRRLAALQI